MLELETVEEVIFAALRNRNDELPADEQIAISQSTPLFGKDAILDSLSFISVIVDIETTLNSDFDLEIALTDDRAMSREVSPFSSVATLRDYILELVAELKK